MTRETLDKEDELSVLNFGAEEYARNHFNDLKRIDFSPKNWFNAYKNNNIIGLVIPSINQTKTIFLDFELVRINN